MTTAIRHRWSSLVDGAIFAATYAGLYAKFASQWTYLASLYNQIKAAECSAGCDAKPLAQWKAGYLEDALELHLALKPNVASIIHMWGRDADVEKAFREYTPGGADRFEPLMQAVRDICERTRERSLK